MKQKYYTLHHHGFTSDVWVSTVSADKQELVDVQDRLKELGKVVRDIEEVFFDNFFTTKTWGPGSEYRSFRTEGFHELGAINSCKGESEGHRYCVQGNENNAEVLEAVAADKESRSSVSNAYYSRAWV